MSDYNSKDLSFVRLERAEECLEDARKNIRSDSYKNAANRSYYAIFHAMRAVLALDKFDSKKHSGIIAEFRNRYIRTGIFDTELSDIITRLFDIRGKSDYDDYYVISKEETQTQVENAEKFVKAIKDYLQNR